MSSTKQLIKEIAELKNVAITDKECNEVRDKLSYAYLDKVLDEFIEPVVSPIVKNKG